MFLTATPVNRHGIIMDPTLNGQALYKAPFAFFDENNILTQFTLETWFIFLLYINIINLGARIEMFLVS